MDWRRRNLGRRRRSFQLETLEHRRLLAGVITQVNYFDTWDAGIIRSTDVAGITYHPPSGTLFLSDSEINELPAIFNGDNIFQTSLTGNQVFNEIASGNTEPTGIEYNPFDGYFYVTNDTGAKTITRYDNNLNNPLLVVSTRDAVSSASDPEGIAVDPANGFLYVSDGRGGGKQVLVYNSNLQYQYRFSVSNLGDAEGIAFHQPSGHLFIIDGTTDLVHEYTLTGTRLQQYDIGGFTPKPKSPQGLTFGPTSNPYDSPSNLALYIADGGSDNYPDGRVYEAVIGATQPGNTAPTTSGIANVNVGVNAPDHVISLWGAFADAETPDAAMTYTIQNNTNPALFTATTINASQGSLTLDFSPTATGTSSITVRATDTGSPALFAETTFTVTVTPGGQTPTTVAVRVSSSSDDAEEGPTGGMSLTSTDLEMVTDGTKQQVVGMRFNGLNIPQGAVIQNAYVQFQADTSGSAATSLTISGEAANNASTFIATSRNISSRARTSASVGWTPDAWTKGQQGAAQRTPNIASVVQEIVSRSGWSAGNSLALIVTGTGNRGAEAFNGVPAAAPLLVVEYVTTDGNLIPAAVNDTAITSINSPITSNVLANDSLGTRDSTAAIVPSASLDANADGNVSAGDALVIINSLSRRRAEGEALGSDAWNESYDTNGDGRVSVVDALRVINYLGRATDGLVPVASPSLNSVESLDEDLLQTLVDDQMAIGV